MIHSCNPSMLEPEGGRPCIQGHPELHSETLSQNKKTLCVCMYMYICVRAVYDRLGSIKR